MVGSDTDTHIVFSQSYYLDTPDKDYFTHIRDYGKILPSYINYLNISNFL
jgi:hypothetical protein